MAGLTFTPTEKTRTRDGRLWLKDAEFCDGIKGALKRTYDSESHLATTVKGKSALRKVRGALRYFAEEQGWGLSLTTTGDEDSDDANAEFTVTFRAQIKRDMPAETAPRRIRRRKNETEDAYIMRVREAYPKLKGERETAYVERLTAVIVPAT